jgi:membrane protease YdiL (CAAX protease family)
MIGRLTAIFQSIGEPEKPPPWGLSTAIVVFAVAFVAMLAGTFMAGFGLGIQVNEIVVAYTIAGVITAFFVLLSRRKPADQPYLKLDAPPQSLAVIFLGAVGLAAIVDLLKSAILGFSQPVPELLGLAADRNNLTLWIISILFMLIVQPAFEELVFQGVIFPALRKTFGAWLGLILCGVAFGLFHLIAYTSGGQDATFGELWYLLGTPILMGLIFAAVRAYTGSTRAAIVAHAAFGLFAILVLVVQPT